MRLHLEINGTVVIAQLNICSNRKVRGGTLHVYTKCSKINLIKRGIKRLLLQVAFV